MRMEWVTRVLPPLCSVIHPCGPDHASSALETQVMRCEAPVVNGRTDRLTTGLEVSW